MKTRRLQAISGGFLFAIALAVPATAIADDYVGPEAPKVKGEDIARPQPQAQVQVQGETTSRGLPITGGDAVGLTAIGLASVGVGSVLVRRSRRTA